MKLGISIALLAASFAPAARAGTLDDTSVILLCWETVDGAASARCGAETKLLDVLRKEGALLVDAAQAERVRTTLDPAKLATPEGVRGVDLLDAELAIVARIDAAKLGGVGKLQQWGARVAVQVIDVPRARIVATVDGEAQANATSSFEGARNAIDVFLQKGGADRIRTALVDAKSAPADIELWVFDVPGLEEAAAIEGAIERSGVASSWKRTALLKGTGKWRVVPRDRKRGADALARALSTSDVGLVVQGATGGMLQLAWNPAARVRLRALIDVKLDKSAPSWFRAAAIDLAAAQVLDTGFIEPVRDASQPHDVILVAASTSAGAGAKARVTATLKKPGAPGALATASESGVVDDAQARAIKKAAEGFRGWLAKNPAAFSQWERLRRAPSQLDVELELLGAPGGVLRTVDVDQVSTTGIARARVATRLDNLRGRARLVVAGAPIAATTSDDTWTAWKTDAGPSWSAWTAGAPSGTDVVVRLVDDKQAPLALPTIDAPRAARLELEVEGKIGERMYRRTTSTAVLLHPPTTVDFRRLETFAAVVDTAAPWSDDVAAAADAHAIAPTPELARAARVIAGIGARGVAYVADAESPWGSVDVDAVQPPLVTLAERRGDRDALAALWLSALASERLETRLVRAGSSLLVAVHVGVPVDAWPLLASEERGTLVVDGRRFAVLDPTTPGGDLYAAIRRGAAALASHKGKPEIVVVTGRGAGALAGPAVTAPAARARVRVLVWDVAAAAPADAALAAAALDDVTRALGASTALEVLSKREVKTLISVDAERRMLGCDDPSCFVDVAKAVSARFVVAGSLGRERSGTVDRPVVALSLLDTVEGKAVSRQRASVDDGALPVAVRRAALRMADPLFRSATGSAAPPDVGLRAHVDELVRTARDPRARVRVLALAGDLDEARAEAARITDAAMRRRYEENVTALTTQGDVMRVYFTKEW